MNSEGTTVRWRGQAAWWLGLPLLLFAAWPAGAWAQWRPPVHEPNWLRDDVVMPQPIVLSAYQDQAELVPPPPPVFAEQPLAPVVVPAAPPGLGPGGCVDCGPPVGYGGPGDSFVPPGAAADPNWAGYQTRRAPEAWNLGIGAIHLPFAPFQMDYAQPAALASITVESFYNWEYPDRAEYLWAATGGGGLGPEFNERQIDFQELRFYMERGGEKISAFVELPIRSVDPEFNLNTTGFSDMNTGTKVVLYDEGRLLVSQIFTVYIPTGLASRGLGSGHVSLEPGVLFNYQASCTTYLHGQFKFRFPIAGNPAVAGEVLEYGVGISHLLYERPNSDFAVIPTMELVGWSVLDGRLTLPTGVLSDIDPEGILNFYPGVRILTGERTELGIGGGFTLTTRHWAEGQLRLDLRVFF